MLLKLHTLLLLGSVAIAPVAFGSGTVANCTQGDLETALVGGGTVLFACSGTITLTNTLFIAQDTLLDANSNTVTISGGNAVRLFEVSTNVNFRVNGLTLANGSFIGADGGNGDPPAPGQDGFGAGILNQGGIVTLVGCNLIGQLVQGGKGGQTVVNPYGTLAKGGNGFGAAICSFGGTLNITNCTVVGNSANGGLSSTPTAPSFPVGAYAGQAWGGGVYAEGGFVNLDSTSLSGNSANGGVATVVPPTVASGGGDGAGGAIYTENSTLVMNLSLLVSNSATGGGVPSTIVVSGGLGSGAAGGGGLFLGTSSKAVMGFCTFASNSASGGNGEHLDTAGPAVGGAIFNGGNLQVSDSTFSDNASLGGSRSVYPAEGMGGGICSTGTLAVSRCTFVQNIAVGGDAEFETDVTGSGAAAEGGALLSLGVVVCTNSTITGNRTLGGGGGNEFGPGPGGAAVGGGVCFAGGTALLINLTIAANRADGTNDHFPGFGAGPSEGGDLSATNAAVSVQNCIIADSPNGGEVWGTIIDDGYNICSDGSANLNAVGSLNNTDPLLEALSDNGGPTPTMGLLVGSPARDAIPSGFPPTDQRGVSRPQGPAGDIGAFEANFISAAPSIVTQPQGVTARAGTNVTFTVGASGTEPLFYQWSKDGNTNPILGAAASSLVLSNVQAADQGTYSVVVTNIYGSAASTGAVLVVDSTPLILTDPTSVIVSAGASTSFSVTADGPALNYQWYHNSNAVTGGTGATLTIGSALAGAQGDYFVLVSNFAGVATSTVAKLSFDATALNILVQPTNTTAETGYPASFSVLVSGVPPFAYQWQHGVTNVIGETNSTLKLISVSAADAGVYGVMVSNGYRTIVSATASLTVTPGAVPPQLVLGHLANTLTITFNAEAGRQYRLLISTNFSNWTPISTNSVLLSGPVQFTEPLNVLPKAFYRVVTP